MPPNLEKKRISAEQLTLQTGSSCANKKTVVQVDFTKFVENMYILNIPEICKIRRTLEKDISHNLKLEV